MSGTAFDLEAIYAQGKHLMSTGDTPGGMEKFRDAAHAGHAEASHHIAMLLATEGDLPDHWEYALAYVGRAAKAGHLRAQRTLAFLAGDKQADAAILRGDVMSPDTWYRLHDAIDPQDWLKPAQKTVVRETPHIATIEQLITPAMCDWIREMAAPKMQRALVYDVKDGNGVPSSNRTNSDMRFSFPDTDLVLMFTGHMICKMVDCKFLDQEDPSVLHYKPGQQFKAHHDYLNPRVQAWAKSLPVQGQRIWTLLIYLNDDYDGGETVFPKLDYKYKGKKGDALLFRNVDEKDQPDPMTLHAGVATTQGEKWVFSQWIRKPLDWAGAQPVRVAFEPGAQPG